MDRLEKIMERLVVQTNSHYGNQPQNQNHNFRKNPPQMRQRDTNQQIRPPFQENYVGENEGMTEEPEETIINMLGVSNEYSSLLTEDD